MKFIEEKLGQAVIAVLEGQGYPHHRGESIERQPNEVLTYNAQCGLAPHNRINGLSFGAVADGQLLTIAG